jgi:hypothetical protein
MAAAVVSTWLLAGAIASGQNQFPASIITDVRTTQNQALGDEIPSNHEDESVDQAAWMFQQPPSLSPPNPQAARRTTGSRQSGVRLASVPNMFGDCGMTTANVTLLNVGGGRITDGTFMLPMVGGSRTAKMAENDIAMPVDRVFCSYNHYSDIFQMHSQQTFPPGPGSFRQEPIDRYTLGAEKTFFNGMTSVEVRMPFTGSFDATLPGVGVSNGNFGNLAVILKGLLYQGESLGIGTGLGIDTPTGSGVDALLGTVNPINLRFQNQAVHLLPWIGFLYSQGDPQWGWGNGLFMTGFLQFDAAANGNTIQFINPATGNRTDLGKFNEQNVLFVDLAMGYWLYRDSFAPRWTGLAVIGEMHYTTSMQDPDQVAGATQNAGAVVTNPSGRFDVVNGTIGIQALMFDKSSLRVAGVFPMGSRMDQRFFDSEVQVQFNRRF